MSASDSSSLMRCVKYFSYGGPEVLQLSQAPKPEPKPTEVRIKIFSTTASTGDWRVRSSILPDGFGLVGSVFFRLGFGISGPRNPILGSECSGVIDSIGSAVTKFKVGDAVFAFPGSSLGCYSEFRCIDENGPIALKPENCSFNEAAALCFGGVTMLDFYRRAAIKPGDRVLINGSSGCCGLAAVQLAKYFGCSVSATVSQRNSELVASMGADEIIDYQNTNLADLTDRWDIIVDTVGSLPFASANPLLKDGGTFLPVLASFGDLLKSSWYYYKYDKIVIAGPSGESPEDVRILRELVTQGKFRSHVDRVFSLDEIVEAHKFLDQGRKRGSIVIEVNSEADRQ